jgi:hypothetical protein
MLPWILGAAAAAFLGYEYATKRVSVTHPAAHNVRHHKHPAAPDTDKREPAHKPHEKAHPAAKRSKLQAANDLLSWLNSHKQGEWGTKANPSAIVKTCQLEMGALVADGIYGPKTQARGESLTGKRWPGRHVALQVTTTPPPSHRAEHVAPSQKEGFVYTDASNRPRATGRGVDAPTMTAAQREKQYAADRARIEDKHKPLPQHVKRKPADAARDLLSYLHRTSSDLWGAKNAPNATVRAAQADMGALVADGIYGPRTQARGTALAGTAFPTRGEPRKSEAKAHPAATRTKEQAASDLLQELKLKPKSEWGTRSNPNPTIKACQLDMGGLIVDGIYGPKTQARGAALLMQPFPAR